MGWHLLETLLQQVADHSTLISKLWLTATFIFRFIVVASLGDAVYSDEQSDFTCNTLQTGCENVCFSQFSPISHLRFWAAQIILISTPSIVHIVYALHKLMDKPKDEEEQELDDEGQAMLPIDEEAVPPTPVISSKKRKGGGSFRKPRPMRMDSTKSNPPPPEAIENIKLDKEEEGDDEEVDQNNAEISEIERQLALLNSLAPSQSAKEKARKRSIHIVYVTALLLRTTLEAVFMWLQITLYGFNVKELYQCTRWPCPNVVDCFVSRPKEKTIFLWFMLAVSFVCLMLNIVEIYYLGIKRLRKVYCGDTTVENTGVGEDGINRDDDGEIESNKSSNDFNMNNKLKPSAPSIIDPKDLYNIVKFPDGLDNDKEASDDDSIGFSNIGDRPSNPQPSFPFIHRYEMLLRSTPPPPSPKASYL